MIRPDVLILAGGYATRLRGIWDGPKCLVPVDGVPLLQRLLDLLPPLNPGHVVLALGHKAHDIRRFVEARHYPALFCTEKSPRGTAYAVRRAVLHGYVGAPLLVLNGDTLPRYDLGALLQYHESRMGAWGTAAVTADAARWRCVYAGACVLSDAALDEIVKDQRTKDFPAHLVGVQQFTVPGFLDVGTPEGLNQATEYCS